MHFFSFTSSNSLSSLIFYKRSHAFYNRTRSVSFFNVTVTLESCSVTIDDNGLLSVNNSLDDIVQLHHEIFCFYYQDQKRRKILIYIFLNKKSNFSSIVMD